MFKRGNVWYTTFLDPRTGMQRWKSLETGNKNEARNKEAEFRTSILAGSIVPVANVSLNQLLDVYLSHHVRQRCSVVTQYNILKMAVNLRRIFGEAKVDKFKKLHLAEYEVRRRSEGVSSTTIRHELRIVLAAFKLGAELDMVRSNVLTGYRLPKGNPSRVRYLVEDEPERLMRSIDERHAWLRPIVIMARQTGLRLSNILGLKWSEVNFDQRLLKIDRTKTGRPITLPMTDAVHEVLVGQCGMRATSLHGLVFVKPDGSGFKRNHVSKTFCDASRQAGISDLRFHDLRHDCASYLAQTGVPIQLIAAWLGHSSVEMTARYAHLNTEALNLVVNVLNRSSVHSY